MILFLIWLRSGIVFTFAYDKGGNEDQTPTGFYCSTENHWTVVVHAETLANQVISSDLIVLWDNALANADFIPSLVTLTVRKRKI